MVINELIIQQAKTIAVMFCCGILVQTLYFGKIVWQSYSRAKGTRVIKELVFWAASTAALSNFLYYCAFGQISFHAGAGFLAGLLLWKKLHCGIIALWVKKDEADSLKTTARSSISMKLERAGWRKGVLSVLRKKKKHVKQQRKKAEEIWPSELKKEEE